MEKKITLNIDEKMIYEKCLKDMNDEAHLIEWRKVCQLPFDDVVWDKFVIDLCIVGKGSELSEAELDYLVNLMLPDCHN